VGRQTESAIAVGAMAFVVLFGYALARPASESLFLEAYGSAALPRVWIAVAIAIVLAVSAYNAAAATRELRTLMLGAIALSGALLIALLLLRGTGRWASFALYVWKDVHVVVLLECLWSFANLVFSAREARTAYGLFCAAGSIGGISGNLAGGGIAKRLGTVSSLWLVVAVFAIEAVIAMWLAQTTERPRPPARERARLGDLWSMLRSSAYLPMLISLVAIVQLSVNVIDYQFSAVIERTYPAVDHRTEVIGHVYALIDGASLVLQLATAVVLRSIGVAGTLLGIPLALGAALGWFGLAPGFASIAVLKVMSKVLDYSLFRAAKEMLYIPLRYEDKTRGKALADMLTYRVAKGGASLLLAAAIPLGIVGLTSGALLVAWVGVSLVLVGRYRELARND
jgi:AAA family ATP:ADP antiporter